jgi:hypothetical protein
MRIENVAVSSRGTSTTLSGLIVPEGADEPRTLWYRFEGFAAPPAAEGDAFAAAALPFCMYEAEPCRVEGPLTPALVSNLDEAQRVLLRWYDSFSPVAVTGGAPTQDARSRSPAVACCFSGGVDSWFSLLTQEARITHLLLLRGFDIGLTNDALWRSVRADAEEVARRFGKVLIVCETNLRSVVDKGRAPWGKPFAGDFWGRCLHGAALASVALALRTTIGELIVPSTYSLDQLKPWGSSPVLDRYWSNGWVSLVHDGAGADRVEKVRAVADHPLALSMLRVCYYDLAQRNCGRCEKCLRTMLALKICGALDSAVSFPGRDAMRWRLMRLEILEHQKDWYEALAAAAHRAGDHDAGRLAEIVLGRRFSTYRHLALTARRIRRTTALLARHSRPQPA